MIIDNIKNAALYYSLGERFKKGLKFLEGLQLDSESLSVCSEIDGEKVYAMVHEYIQKPSSECKWEAHRRYADIQFVADGAELIGYAWKGRAKTIEKYDDVRDVEIAEADGAELQLNAGDFAIFMPEDVHRPGIAPQGAEKSVIKVVVKVKMD